MSCGDAYCAACALPARKLNQHSPIQHVPGARKVDANKPKRDRKKIAASRRANRRRASGR